MRWYVEVLKKYAVFSGRARRRELWMFVLVDAIISIILAIADSILGTDDVLAGLLSNLYSLGVLVPSVAVTVRRLHDIDRTGWWTLLVLVPVIGWIVLIVFNATEGTRSDNRYGPDPKAAERVDLGTTNADPGYPRT